MADFLFGLHSGMRYLVLLAALLPLAALFVSGLRTAAGGRFERIAMAVFIGLLDLQVLIGVLLLTQWPFYAALTGHLVMMVLAAAAAHAGSIRARRGAPERATRTRGITVAVTLVLIVGGILAIQRPLL